jgi:cell division protein FtsW
MNAMAQVLSGRRDPGHDAAWDYWLAGTALALVVLGLVMVASASVAIADRRLDQPLYYFYRHLIYVAAGLAAAATALALPVRAWRRVSGFLLLTGIVLLGLVLVPGIGREVNGSMRWIGFGAFNLQPSELVKVFMWMYLAGYLVRRGAEVRGALSGFAKPLVLLMVIAVLLLLEPDYGATAVLFATVLGMLFLGGVPLLRFTGWLLAALAILAAAAAIAPYRLQRLTSFLDPWADPFASGFQLTQALMAVGRGEWLGVGLGNGVQKLFYLPEAHTDFLFAVLGEELGFAGMTLVLALFTFLAWRAFAIARRAEVGGCAYGAYLAYGIGLGITLQALVNVGVNLGVLPTKGLTLPLMSYGGSSMVANGFAVGLLLRLDMELRRAGRGRR